MHILYDTMTAYERFVPYTHHIQISDTSYAGHEKTCLSVHKHERFCIIGYSLASTPSTNCAFRGNVKLMAVEDHICDNTQKMQLDGTWAGVDVRLWKSSTTSSSPGSLASVPKLAE